MKFLEVKNNKTYGDDFPPEICRELIRTDLIEHIYIVLSDRTAICIEYKDRKGKDCEMYETFDAPGPCNYRFDEISRFLTKGE